MNYVLITGANSGLGKAFAQACARRGFHLILLELPGSNIRTTADSLVHEYGISVRCYELDLTDTGRLHAVVEDVRARYPVFFLINNAGIGGTALLVDTPPEHIDRMLSLNVRSTALLTRLMIPALTAAPRSYILNVSSMAAFTPIAYKTVYPASKAFVSSFSLGLRQELKGNGVSVSVLYPGPVMTNAQVSRRILGLGTIGQLGLLSTGTIAEKAIRRTLGGKPVIIPGLMNQLGYLVMSLLPLAWKMKLVSREVKKELQFSAAFE